MSTMETVLLTLALATCAESPDKCTYTEIDKGKVVTVCGLAPEKGGRPISFQGYVNGEKYFVTLEPQCVMI